jgi:uncharacterized protein (UPF0332 family)
MDPHEFLDLAGELAAGVREGDWRSAASRAYYAAFHVARCLFVQIGFRVPHSDRAHSFLYLRLNNCGQTAIVTAAQRLRNLRDLRNEGDYDFDTPFAERLGINAVNEAVDVVDILEAVPQDAQFLARITQAMRDYERDVLSEVTWQGQP